MRRILILISLVFIINLANAQTDSVSSTADAKIAMLQDSLELVYSENLTRLKDSLKTAFETHLQKDATKYDLERAQLDKKIQMLADSIKILKSKSSSPAKTVLTKGKESFTYDENYEKLYFQYLTNLKDTKEKKSFFGLGTEKLTEFKLLEMKRYLAKYFPYANSEKVQEYIVDICSEEKMYAEAEMELLKYAYLYIETDNYGIMVDKFLKKIDDTRYYKNRSAFIIKKVNSILKNTSLPERYFQYIELLNSYPDEKVRSFLQSEARDYLKAYIELPRSAEVIYWCAQEYLKTNEPHKAFITAEKLLNNYPNSPLYADALHFQAKLQEEQFKEHKESIDTYERFITKFPDHSKAQTAMYKIPEIFDTQMKDYESAVSYYKQFADKYQSTDQAVIALQRAAEIYNKEMKALQSSVDTYTLIEQRYPDTPHGIQALLMTGTLYQESKYYKTAVVQYAEVYKKYPRNDASLTALQQSAVLYLEKLNDKASAIKVLNLIIEYFPETKSAKQARERLESLTEEAEKADVKPETQNVVPDTSNTENANKED